MSAKPEQGLLGLPLVVFRMILGSLHEDDSKALYSLRSVSRACRHECDALIFRSGKLQDHVYRNEHEIRIYEQLGDLDVPHLEEFRLQRATKGLMQCILDEGSSIAKYVRHLQIGTLRQDFFDSIIAPDLERVLTSLTNLQSLSWDTSLLIPERILNIFHTTHPTARLHVTNCMRDRKPMDRLLLSSPQLYSLQMNLCFEANGVCPFVDGRNEFQILKNCLLQGNSIKVLHLALQDVRYWKTLRRLGVHCWEDGPLNLHWQDGDRFPALQEWRWSGRTEYVYSTQHLEMWRRCMDWRQLRVLDFGTQPITSMLPFESLASHVPQLAHLAVAISSHQGPDMRDPARVVPIFENFLHSITALKILRLEWAFMPSCLPIILHHQGPSLRELDLCYVSNSNPWDRSQCIEVLTKAPRLCYLRVQTNTPPNPTVDLQGRWYDYTINSSPSEKYTVMKDVGIEQRERIERQHAVVMKRLRDRRQPEPAVERTPQQIARTLELARINPRGE